MPGLVVREGPRAGDAGRGNPAPGGQCFGRAREKPVLGDSFSQTAPRPLSRSSSRSLSLRACGRRGRKMAALVVFWSPARGFLRRCWGQLERSLLRGLPGSPWAPALAVQTPATLLEPVEDIREECNEAPNFLDSIFWMAAPKKRRTIEVNRCRRRNPNKLIKIKTNIDICPECGNLKQKHVLCGYCYKKIKMETGLIRIQIKEKEAGPFNAPTVETVVLYEGEKPTKQDEGKRIIERNRKRPSWFTQN